MLHALLLPLLLATTAPAQVPDERDWHSPATEPWGSYLAVPRPAGQVHLLDVEAGRVVASFDVRQTLRHLAVQPGGQRVAVITDGGLVATLDVLTKRSSGWRDLWPDDKDFGQEVRWSPDGTRLLATGFAERAWLIDGAGEGEPVPWTVGAGSWIAGGAWAADGARLALGSYQGRVRVLDRDLATVQMVSVPWDLVQGCDWKSVSCVALDATGRYLAIGTSAARTFVWDLEHDRLERVLDHSDLAVGCLEITAIAFRPDGTRLVDTGNDWWQVREWDLGTGKELWRIDNGSGNPEPILARYAADGAQVLTNLWGSVIESGTGRRIATFYEPAGNRERILELMPDGRSGWIPTCAGVEVYDVCTRALRYRLSGGRIEPKHD